MKYIILLFILTYSIIAQNLEPNQRSLNILGSTNYYIDTDTSEYFNIDNQFHFGWQ